MRTPDLNMTAALAGNPRLIEKLTRGLGTGVDAPWANRTAEAVAWRLEGRISYPVVAAWVNGTYSVQLIQHPGYEGFDHLLIKRHDDGAEFPWRDLQRLKDRFVAQDRWAVEYFPPALDVVDNANLRHLWVMPADWSPPIQLGEDVIC